MRDKLRATIALCVLCCGGGTGCLDAVREGAVAGAGGAAEAAINNTLTFWLLPAELAIEWLRVFVTGG